jgi:glycosyltransferase involved in cell wall biosynthesis
VGAILDFEKPDVVHTNNLTGFSVSIWKEILKRKIRLVHTLRDYSLACFHVGLYRKDCLCERHCADCRSFSSLRKIESAAVSAVVGNSTFTLEAHQRFGFFQGVPSSTIFNICDDLSAEERKAARNESEHIFGFIGALEPKKGIEILLRAMTDLSIPNWRLKIAGSGFDQYVLSLKGRYSDPRIEWLGFIAAEKFYSSVDTVVIPSLWPEPLPRTFIEALSFGCSAICASSGGIEEIAGLGKVVRVYPPLDHKSLTAALQDALLDRERWSIGGFKSAEAAEAFSPERIVSQYRDVYKGNRPR